MYPRGDPRGSPNDPKRTPVEESVAWLVANKAVWPSQRVLGTHMENMGRKRAESACKQKPTVPSVGFLNKVQPRTDRTRTCPPTCIAVACQTSHKAVQIRASKCTHVRVGIVSACCRCQGHGHAYLSTKVGTTTCGERDAPQSALQNLPCDTLK